VTRTGLRLSKAALLSSVLTASCGAPLMKLPTGPGTPATDAAAVVTEALAACRAVRTITLEISVHGTAHGHRLRGRLTAGLAAPASARLEAVAPFGEPVFVFVAMNDDASLLLPRDRRVLEHGKPIDVLEAVSGVPLDVSALRSLLTGCANMPDASDAVAFGADWRVAPDGSDEVYFRRSAENGPWRVAATSRRGAWRSEYSMYSAGLPRAVRLVSQPPGRFDLQMDLSQVDVNVAIGAEAFRFEPTGAAAPITLEELRQSGPLGEK